MQRRRRKRFRAEVRVPLALPKSANEAWTMDYTHDELASGRKFRTLNLMDGYTREAAVDRSGHVAAGTARGAGAGAVAGEARDAGGDPGGQRDGVHQSGGGPVGVSASGGAALHRAREADAERVHRKLQREVP